MIPFLANHMWQSTLTAAVAWLLTLALKKNRAALRYWIWLAASAKFVIPFALLISIGSSMNWRTAPNFTPFPDVIEQISEPFDHLALPHTLAGAPPPVSSVTAPACIWLCGFAVVLASWLRRWWLIETAMRSATPMNVDLPIKVMSHGARLEPGIFGVFKPVLLVHDEILSHLTPEQWQAILAHELCHVRRRDNLTAAIHMAIEAVFWFNPVVWWLGRRLVDERERACDEEVLIEAAEPHVYAEGILAVCRLYLKSPLLCASGVSGSRLTRRIRSIMTRRVAVQLDFRRKLLLTAVGFTSFAGPIAFGLATAPQANAQPKVEARASVSFEVASVRPSNPRATSPDGFKSADKKVQGPGFQVEHMRFSATSVNLFALIVKAYGLTACRPFGGADCVLLSGGPDWLKKSLFDVQAKMPDGSPDYTFMQLQNGHAPTLQLMLQSLLADRFHLKIHHETRQLPVFELAVWKKGPKLKKADASEEPKLMFRSSAQLKTPANGPEIIHLIVENGSIQELAELYSKFLDRPILDKTALTDRYDFTMDYEANTDAPGPLAAVAGPGLFKALHEQAGLELKAAKGPVEVIVIDHAERPSKN